MCLTVDRVIVLRGQATLPQDLRRAHYRRPTQNLWERGLPAKASVQTPTSLRRERHHALVVSLFIRVADDLERFLADRLTMQEGIDLGVGHAVGCFVRFAR